MASDKLTIKQEKYAQGLFKGMTQREAYKAAYDAQNMTDKSIDEKACELAANVKVKERIEDLVDQFTQTSMITKEYILSSLNNVARRCQQVEPVLIKEDGVLVESGEYKFDSSGANKSLELLGKHLKLFTEKVESTSDVKVEIIDDTKIEQLMSKATDEEMDIINRADAIMKELEKR